MQDAKQVLEEKGTKVKKSINGLARAGAALQAVALSGAELGGTLEDYKFAFGRLNSETPKLLRGKRANKRKKSNRKTVSASRRRNR